MAHDLRMVQHVREGRAAGVRGPSMPHCLCSQEIEMNVTDHTLSPPSLHIQPKTPAHGRCHSHSGWVFPPQKESSLWGWGALPLLTLKKKSVCCSCSRPEFDSQHPNPGAHNHLQLQLQVIQWLWASKSSSSHAYTHTLTIVIKTEN